MKAFHDKKFNDYYVKHKKHLRLKGLQPKTIDAYSRTIRRVGEYFVYRIDRLTEDQLLDYFSDLLDTHSWSTVKLDLYGLKFFYEHVLNQSWTNISLVKPPKTTRIIDIVSINEAQHLFMSTQKLSYRVFFFTIYSMGLRLSEGQQLKVGDIDECYKRVHIRNAKGNKDRFVPLPEKTLQVLRKFWKVHQHPHFLFPNRKRGLKQCHKAVSAIDKGGIQKAMRIVVKDIGLKKNITPHSLRHSYATHLVEAGVDLLKIQSILGHASLLTTVKYTHSTMANNQYSQQKIEQLMNGFNIQWGNVK